MDSGAEGDVPVRLALQIEPLRMRIGLRIHVGGGQHGHDLVAPSQPDAAEFDIPAHVARLGELHRRDEAQKFLDRQIERGSSPASSQSRRSGFFKSSMHRSADQMRGGLVAGEQQQEHHRHDFVAADLPAVLLDAHDLGDQPLTAAAGARFRDAVRCSASSPGCSASGEKAERAGEAGEAAGPGDEFWPVGKRQPEQLADHRQRQFARKALDEVGRARPPRTVHRRVRRRAPGYAAPCRARRGGERPRRRCRAAACDRARPSTACCWRACAR